MPPQSSVQYLCVKRRRTDSSPQRLRLESKHVDIDSGKQAVLRRVPESEVERSSYPIMKAILEEDDDGEEDVVVVVVPSKRRRLTLLDAKAASIHEYPELTRKKKKKAALLVFNPLERMVDESLKQVYQGEITPRQHYDSIMGNELFLDRPNHWLTWKNVEMGNLLHACALWNDAELLAELLSTGGHFWASTTTMALDGDGRTPFQIAQIMGHDQVISVLEAFGLDQNPYVYDWYALLEEEQDPTTNLPEYYNHPNREKEFSCQVQGGYWDSDGRLFLEENDDDDNNNHRYVREHDLARVDDDDENDPDSNDEGNSANDYPDHGDEEEGDDDDIKKEWGSPYDLAQEDFDAAYGIYGQTYE